MPSEFDKHEALIIKKNKDDLVYASPHPKCTLWGFNAYKETVARLYHDRPLNIKKLTPQRILSQSEMMTSPPLEIREEEDE